MVEVKTLGGGLNKDDSQYRLPPNDYIDALNISHDAVEGSNDQIITPIISNRIGDDTYVYPSGTNKCIGACANTLRNTIIQFLWNSDDFHLILEYNLTTRLHTKIFENLTDSGNVDILEFTQSGKILSINIYNRDEGDLLFFLDSLGRPTGLDISLFKQGEYTPVTRAIIDKGKKPPLSPPSVIYDNDTTIRSNDLRKRLFRFKYRWIYDDFEKSTFSPISIVPLPVGIISDTYTNVITNNNVIRFIANTGDKNVKSVEIAMSFVENTNDWSDFGSVIVIKKSELGLQQTTILTPGAGLYDQAYISFSGVIIAGTIVNIYLTNLPSTQTLVATYTVQSGDTYNDIVNGLTTSMTGLGIIFSFIVDGDTIQFLYYNPTYAFDKVQITQGSSDNDNIAFGYSFYNDSTYPTIPIDESIQLFDYVPPYANAQEMPNGNILAYIGITEGYDKDTIENAIIIVGTVPAGNGAVGSLNGVVTLGLSPATIAVTSILFSGTPATGTVISIRLKNITTNAIVVVATYTTVPGDTIGNATTGVIGGLITSALALGLIDNAQNPSLNTLNIVFQAEASSSSPHYYSNYTDLIIIAPSSSIVTNSIPTWKWSTGRNIARAYFDEKGVTNGILYTDKVTFPAYAEDGSNVPLVPYINYKINDIPPEFAFSMQFYMTKENTQYIFWESLSVDKSEAEYIYFEVTSFIVNASKKPTTATVLSYSFQDGDRIRVIRNTDVPGIVFDYTYDAAIEGLVVDPTINSTPITGGREFIKIKNIEPFTSNIDGTKNYVIELYRPSQQASNTANQVYYEFGQEYAILDPTLSTRRHSGMVTNQTVGTVPAEYNFYAGDAYFRSRTIATREAAGYATFNVMDRNFVDFYISAVNSVDGRPNIIDLNARQAYYSTLIRHGEAYQANTNINGLNRFYSKNFDEYPISNGDALRMKVKDRQLIIMQKFKIGHVPLFSSIGKDPNGLTVVFNTDKLLNPIDYYAGDFGIGTCPESVASFNFAIYGCDNIKGIIWRLSNDGLIAISQKYKMNSWANDNLTQSSNQKIYGAFDQRLDNYIIAKSEDDTVCVPASMSDFNLPDGVAGIPYNFSVRASGTLAFTIVVLQKPDWMNITVSGKDVVFLGIAQLVESDTAISFTISNPCGQADIGPIPFNVIEMITGTIDMWGGDPTALPAGWLLCDGTAISRVTFADLFAVIGITFGAGNGTTTFNLPNIQKKFVGGYDSGDIDYGTVGDTGGANSLTLSEGQLPSHFHYVAASTGQDGLNDPWPANRAVARNNSPEPSNAEYRLDQAASGVLATIGNSSLVGSGASIDISNAYIVLPFKIKT